MSIRTPELADKLVDGIEAGIPLRQLCRTHGISKSEVYRWQDDDAEFKGRIARARPIGFDAIAEECLEIADDARNDFMTRVHTEGEVEIKEEAFNAEHVQRSKLRIETRLKLLAKWDPRYAEKVQQEHTGPNGGPMQVETITRRIVKPDGPADTNG